MAGPGKKKPHPLDNGLEILGPVELQHFQS